ncbi:MAG: tetratricopeptide repeat protein [Oleiphilaceae bacterium]|nr:tetratricopeptide repeat protein [Oleiphilaceae bacterium]
MRSFLLTHSIIFAAALGLAGCGSSEQMSEEEIQYLSRLDQANFFQKQGELAPSTREARNAIELQPQNPEPYFIIISNLLTAGDALNAKRQLDRLIESMDDESRAAVNNRANLIRAKASRLQGRTDEALAHLDKITDAEPAIELDATVVKGQVLLAAGRLDDAELAFEKARDLDEASVDPLIGLSKVAYGRNDQEKARNLIAKAGEIDDSDSELWLWRAQLADANKNWQDAEEAYVRALEDIGQYDVMTYRKYETISALVRVLREQSKSAEAFVYEEILAKSAPGTIKSNLTAAQSAYQDGDLESAANYLEEVLAQAPGHQQSAMMLGLVRFRQGRAEDAERLLAPLAEGENSEEAAKLLAATKIQLQNPAEARKILENLEGKDTDPGVLALIGIATLAGGDKAAGEELIQKSLSLNPDNTSLRLRYGRHLLQEGETELAVAQAREILQRDAESDAARILIIQARVAGEDLPAAVEEANAWAGDQPQNLAARMALGQLAANQDKLEQAQRHYEQAAEMAPSDPTPALALGRLNLSQGDEAKAADYFRAAVSQAPNNREALQGLARVLTPEETVEFLETVWQDNPEARAPKAMLLEYALVQDDAQAMDTHTADLLEVEGADQTSPMASLAARLYTRVAAQKAEAEELDRAWEILNRALALFPENEDVTLQSASLAFRTDKASTALDLLQEAKRNHPDSARPLLLEASYLTDQNRHDEAVKLYELALTKQRTASTELRYASALQRAGQNREAIESLESAEQAFPDEPQIDLALATAYQGAGEHDKAINAYENLLAIQPTNVVALNNLAWTYQEVNDPKALKTAEKAYNLSPDSAAIADTYGWVLLKSDRQAESVSILEKAHELQPQSKEIAMHLVEAYRAIGETAKADAVLEKTKG